MYIHAVCLLHFIYFILEIIWSFSAVSYVGGKRVCTYNMHCWPFGIKKVLPNTCSCFNFCSYTQVEFYYTIFADKEATVPFDPSPPSVRVPRVPRHPSIFSNGCQAPGLKQNLLTSIFKGRKKIAYNSL